MAADSDRVLKRTLEILNLCTAGEYEATLSARNKTRNIDALTDMVAEAGLVICKTLAEIPSEFRYLFLEDSTPITTSGDAMPVHLGELDRILITPYSGGNPVEGKQCDYQKIESYRNDADLVYDDVAHDAEGSSLSGLYDVKNDRFHFTGESAVLTYARQPTRDDNDIIPDLFEPTWIKLSVGNAEKVGTGGYETSLIQGYMTQGMADIQAFIAGERTFPEAV